MRGVEATGTRRRSAVATARKGSRLLILLMQCFRGERFLNGVHAAEGQLLLVRRYESEVLRGTSVRNVHDKSPHPNLLLKEKGIPKKDTSSAFTRRAIRSSVTEDCWCDGRPL